MWPQGPAQGCGEMGSLPLLFPLRSQALGPTQAWPPGMVEGSTPFHYPGLGRTAAGSLAPRAGEGRTVESPHWTAAQAFPGFPPGLARGN